MLWILAASLVLQESPRYDIHDDQIEGVLRKPTMVIVISPPRELAVHDAVSPARLWLAEMRLGLAPLAASEHLVRARAGAQRIRARSDAEFERRELAWAACEATPDAPGCAALAEPTWADFRPVLAELEAARRGPGAASVELQVLGLATALRLEPGPAQDLAGARAGLEALIASRPRGPVAVWAHLGLADLDSDASDLAAARAHFAAALAAESPGPEPQDGPLATYLRYRLAWCDFNLGEPARAADAMKALWRSQRQASGPLAQEAERDAILMLAELPEHVADHLAFIAEVSGARLEQRADRILELAERFVDAGHLEAASLALAALPAALEPAREERRAAVLRALPVHPRAGPSGP